MNRTQTKADVIADQAAEIDTLRAMVAAFENGLASMRFYLESEKFANDPTVQTADVLHRMSEIRSAVADEQVSARGMASDVKRGRWHMEPDYSGRVYDAVDDRRFA